MDEQKIRTLIQNEIKAALATHVYEHHKQRRSGQFQPPTKAEIIEYCREKLPPIAVPKSVAFREELPLTVTEKIFKRVLRDEEVQRMKQEGLLK